jgi:hypothetical protein
MSAETNATSPDGPRPGFLATLLNVWVAPKEAFAAIAARPTWVTPLIVATLLSFGFTGIWLTKVDPQEFAKAQLEQSGRAEKMSPEQRAMAVEMQAKFMRPVGWVVGAVSAPILLLVTSAYFLVVFRFFYAAEISFRQALSVSTFVNVATSLVAVPLMLMTFALKGDWNINPQEIFQANLTLLFDKSETAHWLFALAGSLDLFSFWTIFLLAVGFAAVTRRTAASAAWASITPWAIYVLLKAGWAALMG